MTMTEAAMSEPVGWNVYYGDGQSLRFDHFEPNEPELARQAAGLADEVERRAADGEL